MDYLLIGKKSGVFENKKYFQLFFAKPIEGEGDGFTPVVRESYGKRVAHFSCVEEVFNRIEVEAFYEIDKFYFDNRGKIIGYLDFE